MTVSRGAVINPQKYTRVYKVNQGDLEPKLQTPGQSLETNHLRMQSLVTE